jgi:hypothetical protein
VSVIFGSKTMITGGYFWFKNADYRWRFKGCRELKKLCRKSVFDA